MTNNSKKSTVFWGVLFVSLGSAVLLDKYSLIPFYQIPLSSILSILLIAIGVAFLNISNFMKQTMTAIIAICISLLAISIVDKIAFEFDDYNVNEFNTTTHSQNNIEYNKVSDSANILIKGGAIDLSISSITTKAVKFQSNDSRNYKFSADSLFKNFELLFKPKSISSFKNGVKGDLQLSDSTIWSITAEIGASEINADFKDIKVSKLILSSGASDIFLEFGTKHTITEILIETGASDIEINIPSDAYCELSTNTALSSLDLGDLEEVYSGFYRTAETNNSKSRFLITISGGVSNLTINHIR